MIRYEVTLAVDASIAGALEAWMRGVHIPAILATGCFHDIRLDRGPGKLRTVYHARTMADYQRYLDFHAPHFRADFLAHFPTGASASRAVWEGVEEWSH